MGALTGPGEWARRAGRWLLPPGLYRRGYDAINAWHGVRTLGWREYRRLKANEPEGRDLNRYELPELEHPIYIRPGYKWAISVIQNVLRETYGRHTPAEPIRFIIDAGAFIGDTAAYYLSRFPEARVVAVEPVDKHFAILEKNCGPYGDRVRLIKGALWPHDAHLALDPDWGGRRSSVLETDAGSADFVGISPLTLLQESGRDEIDIFKCDIEGGELQLFGDDSVDEWLPRTRTVFIEIHGPEADAAVMDATRRHGFRGTRYRELHIFRRE